MIARTIMARPIYLLHTVDGITFKVGPLVVTKVRQFLPADEKRPKSLVDMFTDTGRRVVAVADLWGRDPEKASDPW